MKIPTREYLLSLVNKRVPYLLEQQKDDLVTRALAIMAEPKFMQMGDAATAVRMAINRAGLQ